MTNLYGGPIRFHPPLKGRNLNSRKSGVEFIESIDQYVQDNSIGFDSFITESDRNLLCYFTKSNDI